MYMSPDIGIDAFNRRQIYCICLSNLFLVRVCWRYLLTVDAKISRLSNAYVSNEIRYPGRATIALLKFQIWLASCTKMVN